MKSLKWGALIALSSVLIVLLALAGCGLTDTQKTGAIRIVASFDGAKSILPPIGMEPAEWRIVGTGPGTFDVVLPLAGGTISSLTPGTWDLTVYAQNAAHDALGEASTTAEVNYGLVTSVNVSVLEYSSPDGAVHGTIQWEPNIVADPNFNLVMTDTAGVVVKTVAYDLDLDLCTGVGDIADVHPGWWVAVGVLKDGDRDSTGFAAAVRVAAGRTTAMDVALHAVQTSGGMILTFTWNGNDELQITGSPAPGDLQIYTGQTVPMLISSPESGFSVDWYVNGLHIGSGADFDLLASDFNQDDYYRLDAVAISQDHQRGSSLTWNVIKGDSSPAQVRISGSAYTANWDSSNHFVFTLRTAAAPNVVLGTQAVEGTPAAYYAFNGLASGSYVLKVAVQEYPTAWGWWNAAQVSSKGDLPPADGVIVIPQSGTQTFNFPQGID